MLHGACEQTRGEERQGTDRVPVSADLELFGIIHLFIYSYKVGR